MDMFADGGNTGAPSTSTAGSSMISPMRLLRALGVKMAFWREGLNSLGRERERERERGIGLTGVLNCSRPAFTKERARAWPNARFAVAQCTSFGPRRFLPRLKYALKHSKTPSRDSHEIAFFLFFPPPKKRDFIAIDRQRAPPSMRGFQLTVAIALWVAPASWCARLRYKQDVHAWQYCQRHDPLPLPWQRACLEL